MAEPSKPSTDRGSAAYRWLIVLLVGGVVAFFVIRAPDDRRVPGAAGGGGAAPLPAVKEKPPRCRVHGAEAGFRIGPDGARPSPQGQGGREAPDLAPFAAELGRGTPTKKGYAVGVRREKEGTTVFEVALLDRRASDGELLFMDRARGDMDAPTVRAVGDGWAAAMLEPNASGLALRLAMPEDSKLTWGAEIDQGRDESLAHDMAFGDEAGVVVWDDITEDRKRGRVRFAIVKPDDLSLLEEAETVSGEEVDADQPRVVLRAGGFWLAYVARRRERQETEEREGRYAAERIEPSWIELVPLDRQGRPEGKPRPVTDQGGHVLAFDVLEGRDGAAILAWRDDDTPSGAHGGRVSTVMIDPSGGGGQSQLVADKDVGAGVPSLAPGWLALPDEEGRLRLAPMDDEGQVLGDLRPEPALGRGQVIAADSAEELLVARPDGRAVDLLVVRCTAREAAN